MTGLQELFEKASATSLLQNKCESSLECCVEWLGCWHHAEESQGTAGHTQQGGR